MNADALTSSSMPSANMISPKLSNASGSFASPGQLGLLHKLSTLWHRWDRLQISFTEGEPLRPEANSIRASMLIANPGTRPNQIVRISATVQDQNRTFTLQTESNPILIPSGSGLAVEITAANFQPLRLSRQCIFRVALTDRDGKIYRAEHPVSNVWSKDMFPDERD